MSDDAQPKFEWGRRVRATVDLFNDGGFPDAEPEALLVKAGEVGEIVQIGAHVESETTDLSRRVLAKTSHRLSRGGNRGGLSAYPRAAMSAAPTQ